MNTMNTMNTTRESSQSHRNAAQGSVLVALDGSSAANMALPIARVFARQLGARLEILHAVPTLLDRETARERLLFTEREMEGAELHVHVGAPADAILEMARAPETQLIVLTTHGRVIESGHRLGRVAEAVIANTNRPVLLVRPEAVARLEHIPEKIEHMLFPLDGTPTTFAALWPAMRLACKLRAGIDLLYVLSPGEPIPAEPGSIHAPYYADQPQHEWPQWSGEAIERLVTQADCPEGVRVHAFLAFGEIESEVIRFANQHKEDIIVLVRHSHFEAERARVLRKVLKGTPCPIYLLAARSETD